MFCGWPQQKVGCKRTYSTNLFRLIETLGVVDPEKANIQLCRNSNELIDLSYPQQVNSSHDDPQLI
jgi:hypothetical protein